MGQCAAKKKKPASKPLVITKKRSSDSNDSSKIEEKLILAYREERALRSKAKWPNPDSKHTRDIQTVVWDQVRLRRHPGTEACRNFLVQIVLIRKVPKQIPENYYSNLNPRGELAWYLTPKFNSYTHHLDGWEESRPTRLAPEPVKQAEWHVLLEKVPIDTGDVGWKYNSGTTDYDFYETEYENYEALVCPGRHVQWPKISGVFGDTPQFPMHLMKGSIIKTLDVSKPFAIPNHEQAMKQGYLVALHKCLKARGEEADSEEPDIVRRGVSERVTSTAPYSVPLFELTENRGYLSPTCRIVFISHRWLTPDDVNPSKGHPDDAANTKLKVLQKLVKDDDFVFFDLWSIPQAPDRGEDRGKAIHSLNIYVDWCSEFIALCPGAENRKQYGERGWTNLELVSALTPVVKQVVVNKWNTDTIYGSTADRIGFVNEDAIYEPLSGFSLREPKLWKFGHPEDAQAVVPIAQAVREKFENMKKRLDESGEAYVGHSSFRGLVNVMQVIETLKDI